MSRRNPQQVMSATVMERLGLSCRLSVSRVLGVREGRGE